MCAAVAAPQSRSWNIPEQYPTRLLAQRWTLVAPETRLHPCVHLKPRQFLGQATCGDRCFLLENSLVTSSRFPGSREKWGQHLRQDSPARGARPALQRPRPREPTVGITGLCKSERPDSRKRSLTEHER